MTEFNMSCIKKPPEGGLINLQTIMNLYTQFLKQALVVKTQVLSVGLYHVTLNSQDLRHMELIRKAENQM